MNLEELDNLIGALMSEENRDLDLIQFYTNKRLELVEMIYTRINDGLKELSEDEQ